MAKQKRIASVLLSTLFILFLHIDCVVAMPDAKHTICCYLNFFFLFIFLSQMLSMAVRAKYHCAQQRYGERDFLYH